MTSENADPTPPGARPVGLLADAAKVERVYVWAMRRWVDGVFGQNQVWSRFSTSVGAKEGARALSLFERQLGLLGAHARRPLMRHDADCPCLGADEAALSRVVALSASGRLEEAYAEAAPLIRPEGLMELIEASARLGKALDAVDIDAATRPMRSPVRPTGQSLH